MGLFCLFLLMQQQLCCVCREGPYLVLLWEKASVSVQNQVALAGVLAWVQTGTPAIPGVLMGSFEAESICT